MGTYETRKIAMNPVDWVHRFFVVWQSVGSMCHMHFAIQSHRLDKGTVGTFAVADYGRAFGDKLAITINRFGTTRLADATKH